VWRIIADTLVVRDGKIVAQSFAGKITRKADVFGPGATAFEPTIRHVWVAMARQDATA